jgi:hydrogenase nickel incorporation protein HypA/HybF
MHELSLANGIFDIVRQYVPIERGQLVRAVRVRVGDLAGVVPDSLAWCFSAIVSDTPYEQAWLAINPTTGPELQVADIELEEETP